MRKLVTEYWVCLVVIALVCCAGTMVLFPGQAQASLDELTRGSNGIGGDPNDEQDFIGGGGGGDYDDDVEDEYWGPSPGDDTAPKYPYQDQLLWIIQDLSSPYPLVRILFLSVVGSNWGDHNAQ